MPKAKKTSRRPIFRKKFGGVTITVQRCKKAGYEAQAIMRKGGEVLKQRYLATTGEAEALADRWVIESGNAGAKAAAAISEADKRFLMEAKESLAPFGKTLPDALAFYLAHLRSTQSSKPVRDVVDALLLHRQRKGKSDRYQNDLRVRLQRFEKQFGERHIADITREEVEAWLDTLTVAPVTYNNFRRLLHVLWAFALDKQWARENVISRIEAQTIKADRPGILTIAQTRALLSLSTESCLPYLAIALFGGLRDAELKRLDWRDVNLLTGYIRVSSTVSKTGRERLVPITDNMRAWLQHVSQSHGPICPANLRKLLEAGRKAARIEHWPHDATRHSFGTYEMARTKDIGHVSEVMGNSPAVVQRHYKAAIPFEEGAEYFSISPLSSSNVIPLLAAAG